MLRKMTLEDLEAVTAIDESCFPVAWNTAQYTYELKENDYAILYVLQQEEEIIGFIDFWITFDVCQLAKIAIHPSAQGKHYAHELMEKMIEDAQKAECETISLEVRVSNEKAQRLYRAYEFIEVNTRKSYYQDNGEDALVLVKAIGGCL